MPYTTKLLDEHDKEIAFETSIGPSTRGKKYIAFDVFVGQGIERKKVGSMDYNVRLDCIHINRMDNFSNAFDSASTGIIKHMGYLFLEHAMRESFARGSQGRLELEAIELSPIVYFKFGFKKDSGVAKTLSDLLQSIQIISDFNFSLSEDEKLKIGVEIKDKLFFGNYLVKSNDVKTKLLFEQLTTQLVSATTQQDMLHAQKELLHTVEEHMKVMDAGWRASYKELLSIAAFNLNISQDKMDTISFQQALELGTIDEANTDFAKWLSDPDSAKLSKQDFKSQYINKIKEDQMCSAMHLPAEEIEKKAKELHINVKNPFEGIKAHETPVDARIALIDKMMQKLPEGKQASYLKMRLSALKDSLVDPYQQDSIASMIKGINFQFNIEKKKIEPPSTYSSMWAKAPNVFDELLELMDKLSEIHLEQHSPKSPLGPI